MAVRAMNFKMDEEDILDMKKVASVFNMTVTDVVKEAVKEYLDRMKKDPFYRLTANVQNVDDGETEEILSEIESLSDDDLTIESVRRFTV